MQATVYNHLGSTHVVTDKEGKLSQQIDYAPFGEVIYDSIRGQENDYVTDYLFNGKQYDEEWQSPREHLKKKINNSEQSGLYYYSQRYYGPPMFISPDPLQDKRPWESPYSYCGNNPLNRVDPTGMIWDDSQLTDTQKEKWNSTMKTSSEKSPLFKKMYDDIANSKEIYSVNIGETLNKDVPGQFNDNTNTLTFRSEKDMISAATYTEEIFHAYQKDNASSYQSGVEFNREYEAKIAKSFMINEIGSGRGDLGNEAKTLSIIEKATNYETPSLKILKNPIMKQAYQMDANRYGNINNATKYGNANYQTPTRQAPQSLYKMFGNGR